MGSWVQQGRANTVCRQLGLPQLLKRGQRLSTPVGSAENTLMAPNKGSPDEPVDPTEPGRFGVV